MEECLDQTLSRLGVDYLDCKFLCIILTQKRQGSCRTLKVYLIHWPVPLNPNGNHPVFPKLPDGTRDVDYSWKIADTWKQMEALVKKGKVKSIGVSNFSEKKLEEILPTAEIVPAVDQVCCLFIILNDIVCACITDVIVILA